MPRTTDHFQGAIPGQDFYPTVLGRGTSRPWTRAIQDTRFPGTRTIHGTWTIPRDEVVLPDEGYPREGLSMGRILDLHEKYRGRGIDSGDLHGTKMIHGIRTIYRRWMTPGDDPETIGCYHDGGSSLSISRVRVPFLSVKGRLGGRFFPCVLPNTQRTFRYR